MKREPVTIRWCGSLCRTVNAYRVSEHFAVHRAYDHDAWWVVTHLPTGCKMPGLCVTRREAVKRAKALESIRGVDWARPQMRAYRTRPRLKSAVEKVCK